MNQLLQAALSYIERGWPVFPLHSVANGLCTCRRLDCSSPGKHPLVRRGLHAATLDIEVATNWWARWPKANIGVATGASPGIVIIDIDLGHRTNTAFASPDEERKGQKDVWDSFDILAGKLDRTLTALTGGGGVHLIYGRVPPSVGGNSKARKLRS